MTSHVVSLDKEFRVIDFPTKEAAYSEYNKMTGLRCVIHANHVLQSFGGKKCVGYAVEKGLLPFLSRDFRVVYLEDHKPKEFKDIADEKEAIKKFEAIPKEVPKVLVKGNKILKKGGQDNEDYLAMAELIYVNDEPKKISFEIIKPEKAKLISLVDMCKICTNKKANIIHEKCSHLCYCKDCSRTKKDNACAICGQESKLLEVNL